MMPNVNLVAVLVGAVAAYAVGMAWYSPMLFGKKWMAGAGLKEKDMAKAKEKMMPMMITGFLATAIMSYVTAHFVDYADATTLMGGAMAGFWLWLGFVATVLLGSVLWEGKSVEYYGINAGHYLVVLLILGMINAVWM